MSTNGFIIIFSYYVVVDKTLIVTKRYRNNNKSLNAPRMALERPLLDKPYLKVLIKMKIVLYVSREWSEETF